MALAMIAVESASVPSQSKTRSRNDLGSCSAIASAYRGRIEAGDKRRKVRRKGRLELELAAGDRMRQRQVPGMQKHALQALLGQGSIPGKVAIFVVAGQREPQMRQMDPDLMRAPCVQLGFEQRHRRLGGAPDLPAAKHRARRLPAVGLDPYPAFALPGHEL